MKKLLSVISVVNMLTSCVVSHSDKYKEFDDDSQTGERLYIGINSMPKISSYPQYAEVEGANFAYYKWKTDFIKTYGVDSWQKFTLKVRAMHGEPKVGYEKLLLDSKSM